LSELANESRFRKDLIFTGSILLRITVPPLRKRGNDIILLAKYFGRLYSAKYMKPEPEFDTNAMEKLLNHHYPGNVRELQYIIERAVIMTDGDVLEAKDLIFSPIETALAEESETGGENKIKCGRKEYDP
jgi:DNA-binding NtrC family response regulator